MIVALILQSAIVQPLPQDVWASVSVGASLAHTSETIEFLRAGVSAVDGEVTLRRTFRRLNDPPEVSWATSLTCHGVLEAVDRLKTIPAPDVVKPGDTEEIVLDGEMYAVRFKGRYGSNTGEPVRFSSTGGTPLSKWVSGTLSTLKPCWSPTRLKVSG